MPQVSILVSVYNAADTLTRCLDSLLHQTLHDVQIICVDDASTDASLDILRQYQQQHDRVEVIALSENHGQAYARNQAIPLVKAPFTAFLDSDDYMAPNTLQQAVDTFQQHPQTDCVLLDVRYVYPDGTEHAYRLPQPSVLTGHEAFLKALTWDVHGWYVARTELYQQFPFDETCHSYSDDNTTMAHYLHAREVRSCSGCYYFVQRADSCTHQATIRRFDWLLANESLRRQLLVWQQPSAVLSLYEEQRWYNLIDCCWFYYRHRKQFSSEQRKAARHILHRAWQSIDLSALPPRAIRKPGYWPIRSCWPLFMGQEWLLYQMRRFRYTADGKKR